MEGRFRRIFGERRPLIAMAHLPALPGTPLHDADQGVQGIVEWGRRDLAVLLAHPFDAIPFSNENNRPGCLQAKPADVAVMTRVVTELAPRDRPFGVDYLIDARASLAVAMATGAHFIRGVLPGVFES